MGARGAAGPGLAAFARDRRPRGVPPLAAQIAAVQIIGAPAATPGTVYPHCTTE
ncbi:hypothetical protein GQ55_5G100300 [Panicum hallii var. hallii]|uniref:Uncharacterized protein n=1 Tax=Panicum hallii var. hallii TaxID=1504633 RepID=A0A2T7DEQ4_9POAL|nr:hypothetical protein GQ55_5G100300 [Panicum hallii var. hallii]